MSDNSSKNNEKFEPGAAQFGNFINYYTFNSVEKRLQVIPSDLMSQLQFGKNSVICLDIGCNSGDLTEAFYNHLSSSSNEEIFMLGIDIDDVLITRCKERNSYSSHITYEQVNIMDENASKQLETYLQKHSKKKFDIITCFSTTMWIHLNYGDNGLNNFLKNISQLSSCIIIEPQEWKCYRAAVRRMTRLNREKFNIQLLKIRNVCDHLFKFFSLNCDMHLKTCFGETSWGRKMYLFLN